MSPIRRCAYGTGNNNDLNKSGSRFRITAAGAGSGAFSNAVPFDLDEDDCDTSTGGGNSVALRAKLSALERENAALRHSKAADGRGDKDLLILAATSSFNSSAKAIKEELASFNSSFAAFSSALTRACGDHHGRYAKEKRQRKMLLSKLIDIQGNIRVFARVRPLSSKEKTQGDAGCVRIIDETSLLLYEPGTITAGAAGGARPCEYEFDRVFGARSSQVEVFDEVSPLVQSAIDGFNVCVFAYGQTGSGKTHTMDGTNNATHNSSSSNSSSHNSHNNSNAVNGGGESGDAVFSYMSASAAAPPSVVGELSGVVPRALDLLFTSVAEATHETFTVSVSVVEIYNDQVRDLLLDKASYRKCAETGGLDIRQNAKGGIHVPGLTEVTVSSVSAVQELMQHRAAPNRQVAATQMNAASSRSHSLVFVNITGTHKETGDATYGRLVLIDLAGSERVKKSEAAGAALKEAQHINQSLSALGNVIAALKSKNKHIPYRDSKLTYLLQDCLGGNSKCLMFCNVSPADSNHQESSCSLKFAERVRNVQLGAAKKQMSKGIVNAVRPEAGSGNSAAGGSGSGSAGSASSAASSAALIKVKEDLASARDEVLVLKKDAAAAEEGKKAAAEALRVMKEKLKLLETKLESTQQESAAMALKLKRTEKELASAATNSNSNSNANAAASSTSGVVAGRVDASRRRPLTANAATASSAAAASAAVASVCATAAAPAAPFGSHASALVSLAVARERVRQSLMVNGATGAAITADAASYHNAAEPLGGGKSSRGPVTVSVDTETAQQRDDDWDELNAAESDVAGISAQNDDDDDAGDANDFDTNAHFATAGPSITPVVSGLPPLNPKLSRRNANISSNVATAALLPVTVAPAPPTPTNNGGNNMFGANAAATPIAASASASASSIVLQARSTIGAALAAIGVRATAAAPAPTASAASVSSVRSSRKRLSDESSSTGLGTASSAGPNVSSTGTGAATRRRLSDNSDGGDNARRPLSAAPVNVAADDDDESDIAESDVSLNSTLDLSADDAAAVIARRIRKPALSSRRRPATATAAASASAASASAAPAAAAANVGAPVAASAGVARNATAKEKRVRFTDSNDDDNDGDTNDNIATTSTASVGLSSAAAAAVSSRGLAAGHRRSTSRDYTSTYTSAAGTYISGATYTRSHENSAPSTTYTGAGVLASARPPLAASSLKTRAAGASAVAAAHSGSIPLTHASAGAGAGAGMGSSSVLGRKPLGTPMRRSVTGAAAAVTAKRA